MRTNIRTTGTIMISLMVVVPFQGEVYGQFAVTPGFTVETFAAGASTPAGMSFGPNGDLFVGNDFNTNVAAQIYKITPAGVVSAFGDPIFDPDAVLADAAGNVFVGGVVVATGLGRISRISQDGSVTSLFASGGGLGNISDMVFDGAGNIIAPNEELGTISSVSTAGVVSTLVTGLDVSAGIAGITFGLDGNLYLVRYYAGTITKISPTGVILDPAFASGLSGPGSIILGPGGVFGTDFYVAEENGEISTISSTGEVTTFASGVSRPSGLEFGPDGNLYVGEYATGRILRIRPSGATNCAPEPSGLVSWWPGDGNANDIQGSNHGILQNGATFAPGLVGQAFSFDGVNDYVSSPPNPVTGDFTIEFWEKSSSNALYKVALGFAASASPGTNNLIFDFNDPDWPGGTGLWVYWNGGGEYRITTGSIGSFTNGLWHHIALTRSGVNMTLYVNGASAGSTVYAPAIDLSNFDINHIGAGPSPANFWEGSVDEVSIYDHALTPQEIADVYTAGSAGKCTNTPPPVCVTPPSGLVSWWPGGGNANDIQGDNDGTLFNGATFTSGRVGQAFSFDGNDDYVEVQNSPNLNPTQQISVEAWYQPTSFAGNGTNSIVHKEYFTHDPPSYQYHLGVTGNLYPNTPASFNFRVAVNGNLVSVVTGSNFWIPGNWYHLVGTYDGLEVKLYVNGVLRASTPASGTMTDYGKNVLLGAFANLNRAGIDYTPGIIDEVSIYNRALTAQEIADIYNASSAGKCTNTPPPVCVNPPSGLLSWWPGDDNANDIQGSNHGTLIDGATFAASLVDQAFSFDGAGDYVRVPDNSAWDFGVNDFTIDLWMRFNQVKNSMFIHQQYDFGGGFEFLYQAGVGVLAFNRNGFNNGINRAWIPQANTWYHLAVTRTSGTFRLYVNGSQLGSEQYDPNPVSDVSGILRIGDYAGGDTDIGGGYDVNGLIDEVEIFNRALTASEIQSIYNAGSAGKCKECEPPTADAGDNQTICPNASVQIGGDETGSGGNGALTFSWEPTDGLSDATAANPTATPASTTTYTVTVTDANECAATDEVTVTVEDNQAPVITTAASTSLWPPNHQYETITAAQCVVSVQDNCASLSISDVKIDSVTSDEPEDAQGGGDGNTTNDTVIASDCKSVQLRSERQGSGNGRVYTIHLSVSDGNGNTGVATCLVTIPKSQNGNPAIDDGPAYQVTGSCGGSANLAVTGNVTEQASLPEGYALFQNYPNPFNPTTEIAFALPEAGQVTVRIYSETGQLVRQVASGNFASGRHRISWDGRNASGHVVAAGVYLYQLIVTGNNGAMVFSETRRMALVK